MKDRRLRHHLSWVLLLKMLALAALWWMFVRDDRVAVEADAAAAHLVAPSSTPPAHSPSPKASR